MRRPRRLDPGRRDRLIDVTLDVIYARGVAGTTHRAVAVAADVPLGSMTYHFADLDELLALAFTRLADTVADQFMARMRAVPAGGDARQAVIEIIATDLLGHERDLVLSYELYVAAARRPRLRKVTQAWMARSREALEIHFDARTARALDALIEGLVLHHALSTDPPDIEVVRYAVHQLTRVDSDLVQRRN